jgi:hypothetical protein
MTSFNEVKIEKIWPFVLWSENPLRCTTQDEKGLVPAEVPFYPMF